MSRLLKQNTAPVLKDYDVKAHELQELVELPKSIRIAESGSSYSDDEENSVGGAAGDSDK